MNWASLERNCEARHQCHERNVATSALRTNNQAAWLKWNNHAQSWGWPSGSAWRSSWYSLFSHNLEAATAKPSSGWTNAAPVRVCGVLALPPSLCNYTSSRTFWAVENWSQHLLAATLMLLFQICYSQPEHRHLPLAQGKVGEELGPKRTGLNLDEGRVWGPKAEPRIWHPKSVPPLLPASVSVPLKGPENGAAKLPTCPALARKVSKANIL